MPHELTLLRDIALGIVFAALAAHVARLIRQPLILGYIAGGVLSSPRLGLGLVTDVESIELISEIGLILLLYIIGLEIDICASSSASGGRCWRSASASSSSTRRWVSVLLVARLRRLRRPVRPPLSRGRVASQLDADRREALRDKFELKVLSGRLTLGVLVVQDIWAIVFMAVQPSLTDPGVLTIARSIAGGAVLVAAAFLARRYVLSAPVRGGRAAAELVLISAVAWCFVVAGVAGRLGLSREMGALIAGVGISAFPYGSTSSRR